MTKKRRLAYLAMIGNVVIWGAALPIVKPSLEFITPFNFLFFRYLIATPLLIPFVIIGWKKTKPKFKTLLTIIALEFLAVPIPLTLLYHGLDLTSSVEASLIGATSPIFIVLGGIFFLKEKENKKEWLGLSLAFFGTLMLTIQPILSSGLKSSFSLTGNLLVIGHNLVWATYLLLAKKHYKNIPKTFIAGISSIIAAISFLFLGILTAKPAVFSSLTIPEVSTAVLYMGILGTPIAFTLYLYGQNLIEASEASLFNYLTGIVAIPVAYILLRESVSTIQIIAILVIFVGVYIGESRATKHLPAKEPHR